MICYDVSLSSLTIPQLTIKVIQITSVRVLTQKCSLMEVESTQKEVQLLFTFIAFRKV